MEKKKIVSVVLILFVASVGLFAQRDSVIKTGLFRAQANISGGYIFQSKKYVPYISANLDYYINESFSVTGESWISFDIIGMDQTGLRKNYSTFLGLNYHPVRKSRWDPYIGFSAGASIHTINYFLDTVIRESPIQFAPIVGITA